MAKAVKAKKVAKAAPKKAGKKPAVRRVRCEECLKLKDPSVIEEIDGAMVCKVCKHTARAEVTKVSKAAGMKWYAVAVAAMREVRARKEVLKRARERGLAHKVGRILIPTHVEVLTRGATYEVWSSDEADPEAKKLGFISGPDTVGDALFEAILKWPNEATLEVRSIKKAGRVVARNKRSFPGTLIVQCEYDADLFHLIDGVPQVFGILPLRPTLKGYRYPRKEPRQARKPQKWELEANQFWRPVPLEPEEAKAMLDGVARSRKPVKEQVPELDYGPGDRVRIVGGLFKGSGGNVVKVGGKATEPDVTVVVSVMGREVEVEAKHWYVKRAGN